MKNFGRLVCWCYPFPCSLFTSVLFLQHVETKNAAIKSRERSFSCPLLDEKHVTTNLVSTIMRFHKSEAEEMPMMDVKCFQVLFYLLPPNEFE